MAGKKKEALTLERYIRESCFNGIGKLRARSVTGPDGVALRVEVRGLGKRPYAFRLEGDTIITAEVEAKRAKKRAAKPKVAQVRQGVSKAVMEAAK